MSEDPALVKFLEDLSLAADIFQRGDENGREGAVMAVLALRDFLDAKGVRDYRRAPLTAIAEALADISSGRSPGLLIAPAGQPGNPGDPIEMRKAAGLAAAATELLVRSKDFKQSPAAERVATKVAQWGIFRDVDAKKVLWWRRRARNGQRGDKGQIDADLYYAVLEWAKARSEGPREIADIILKHGPDGVPKREM
jgi:hypothetical protein